MKNYFLVRFKTFALWNIVLVTMINLVFIAFKSRDLGLLFSFVSMVVFNFIYMKSNWLLLFPFSRKKLFLYHVVETILFLIFQYVLFLIFYVLQNGVMTLNKFEKFNLDSMWPIGIFSVIFFINPIRTQQQNYLPKLNENYFFSSLKIHNLLKLITKFILLAGMFLFLSYAPNIPVLFFLLVSLFLGYLSINPAKLLVVPKDTFLKWRKICYTITFCCIFYKLSSIYYGLYYSNSHSTIDSALYSVGHLKLPLSKERIFTLAMLAQKSKSPLFQDIEEKQKLALSFNDWVIRANKCKSAECLAISNLLIPESLSLEEKLNRFYILVKACNPEYKEGQIVCTKAKISNTIILNNWLLLSNSEYAFRWLNSNDSIKQYISISAYACANRDNYLSEIEKLKESEYLFVKNEVNSFMFSNNKNQLSDICRKSGYYLFDERSFID